jgi:preprotein translocase subunit Sec61beta
VVGDASVVESMSSKLAGAQVGAHSVEVRSVAGVPEVEGCHIVFVASDRNEGAILEAARDQAALSVGESEGFATRGGVVNFFSEGKKLRFEINPQAAAQAEIEISSRLLRLAKLVADQ